MTRRFVKRLCLLVSVPALGAVLWAGQPPDDQTRAIVAEEFLKARPSKGDSATPKAAYRRTSPRPTGKASGPVAELGLTVWRLRPASKAEEGARLLVQENAGSSEWVPERVEASAPLAVGERVRLSFESSRAGYLYIVDREQYGDGSLSDPWLIFPTRRTRGGDHGVRPGRVIEVPAQTDRPNYFTVKPTREDQTGERLSVIVAPEPLVGVEIGEGPQRLTAGQVREWEASWGAPAEQLSLVGGASQRWTPAEQSAGREEERLLTQEDPAPQTIFRVPLKAGRPALVTITLPYATSPAPR
jgi:Domain of unknown function (DUF4384)